MTNFRTQVGFHNAGYALGLGTAADARAKGDFSALHAMREVTEFTYKFENFFHPYVGELIEELNRGTLADMLDPGFHQSLSRNFFFAHYEALANDDDAVKLDAPLKEIDVSVGGPYSNYNWELLFHVPLTIAVHLSRNQRFAEAQRWFHYIFDPTSDDAGVPAPQRFWKFLAFRQKTGMRIDELLAVLSKAAGGEVVDEELREQILEGYEKIKSDPFRPHAVARTRHIAYQYSVLMRYLDNLVAWGDSLFMQDTVESINEATQRYVLAANLLGPRPQQLPPRGTVRPKSFAELRKGLDEMGNAMVALEGQFPFNLAFPQTKAGRGLIKNAPLFGIGRTLYFCIPRNEKLLAYWDTVADRLFKIRHCMNIEGVVRQLALFDPPLDPGMLVKAAAAGIDIGSIVSGLNQPAGPVRALATIQRALELCGEVRALGQALLAAVEKGDGESLALLRQGHETKLHRLTQEVRFLQWKQAEEATETLARSRANALERYHYHQRLMGLNPDDTVVPETLALDRRELTEENFEEAFGELVGQYERAAALLAYPQLQIAEDESSQVGLAGIFGGSDPGKLYLNDAESAQLNSHLPRSRDTQLLANITDTIAGVLTFVPDFDVNMEYWGIGATTGVFGGLKLSDAGKIAAQVLRTIASYEEAQAGMASLTASYQRRALGWTLESNLAAHELANTGRQLISSLIAEQVARRDYDNVKRQIEHDAEADAFLHEKFTNEELYGWMQGELARLYYEYYRFAFDTARKAERTMKQELMRPEVDAADFVKFNYWDGGRKGLLSGEALYLDLKRMEAAYHDHNKREFELTRHVSLRQLDPRALLELKVTGRCEISVPEWLYDRDCPGHYMRRLKSVAVSLPAVVGPYTGVNATLSLLRSSIRKSPLLKDDAYTRTGPEDDRFVDYFGPVQSVVTSGGTEDSGLFEVSLRDDRFLPFEGAGAVSTWSLELPRDLAQANSKSFRPFDYMTIADVILHVRYTARQGGSLLGARALAEMRETLSAVSGSGLSLLFSLRHDFPTEWAAFVGGDSDFAFRLRKEHFPYLVQGETLTLNGLVLYSGDGTRLEKRTPALPPDFADRLDADGFADLPLPPDNKVLKRAAGAQVFLIISYSF
jgi:hypothetical protein